MPGSSATIYFSTVGYNYLKTIFKENITNYVSNIMYLKLYTLKQALKVVPNSEVLYHYLIMIIIPVK